MQEETSQNFTRRLEQLKLSQGWTDEELSAKIGVSRRMLYLIRTGKSRVTRKTLWKLEQAERAAGLFQPLEKPKGKSSNDWKSGAADVPTIGKLKESVAAYDVANKLEKIEATYQALGRDIAELRTMITTKKGDRP